MVKFPEYSWLSSLSDDFNYSFMIFGNFNGTHGYIDYYYDNAEGVKMIEYTVRDGTRFYNSCKLPATEDNYNKLKDAFMQDRQKIISDLLEDKSNSWIADGKVSDWCCVPF